MKTKLFELIDIFADSDGNTNDPYSRFINTRDRRVTTVGKIVYDRHLRNLLSANGLNNTNTIIRSSIKRY